MKEFINHIIQCQASVIEAMKRLNQIAGSLTLFVVDETQRLVGTLTDGDIRRGLISGLKLSDPVEKYMQKSFQKVSNGFNVYDFKKAREKGIRLLPVLDKDGRIERVYDLKRHKSILPIEVMIMAGGRGKRLSPLTDSIPKPLLPLGSKPIIERNIDHMINYGIKKIYISIKHLGQQIVDYCGDGSAKGVQIEYVWEDQPLGTAGALSLVKNCNTEYILLMNSDLFTNADLEDLYLNTINHNASLGVATVPYSTSIPFGILTTDKSRITGLKEKPVYTHYVNAGIYLLKSLLLNKIPTNTFYNITDLIHELIAESQTVVHNPVVGYWIDIGQHQDYKNAQEIVKHIKNADW